jgi:predicted lipoprotein with Yx(FWY)xxD motif
MHIHRRCLPSITHHARLARAQVRGVVLLALAFALGGIATALPSAASPSTTTTTAPMGTVVSAESSPFGTVLMVGSGQFAGYSLYAFDRNAASDCTTRVVVVQKNPLSCAGSESDKSADWPALTTVGKPVAGPGVDKHLLGEVTRKDIAGQQVTYGGKLLYLFDMAPHQFTGENFVETVLPLPPWHGYWYLVSAHDGTPATGPAAVTTETIPQGPTVLAADLFQGMGPTPIVVYTYTKDAKNHSACTGACSLTWPPVLTTATPQATGLATHSLGEMRRTDGTRQVTFDGKPLYFYSEEVPQLDPATGNPLNPATIGTGNGLPGPAHFGGKFSLVPSPVG